MKIKIYSGLSLRKDEVLKVLPTAEFADPVQRGDLRKDIETGIHVIGIIDGVFYRNMAVSPAEILDALRFGIKVYGSSSMGALRAAELEPYGMIGIGRVFEHIKTNPYFSDDKLGQVFFDHDSREKTSAEIDIELGLSDAVAKGKLTSKNLETILKLYNSRHFTERSLELLKEDIKFAYKSKISQTQATKALARITSIKSQDALMLVHNIAQFETHKTTYKYIG